jgi:hypothetical protein
MIEVFIVLASSIERNVSGMPRMVNLCDAVGVPHGIVPEHRCRWYKVINRSSFIKRPCMEEGGRQSAFPGAMIPQGARPEGVLTEPSNRYKLEKTRASATMTQLSKTRKEEMQARGGLLA